MKMKLTGKIANMGCRTCIFSISQNRRTYICHMDAQLVCSARYRP